eukprot:PITA_18883
MTSANYLIAHTRKIHLSKLLFSPFLTGALKSDVLECPNSIKSEVNQTWKIRLSLILIKLIQIVAVPLAILGTCIEFYLNLLSQNGGLLKILFRPLTGQSIVIPRRGSETFLSIIGLLEHRVNLYHGGTRGVIDSTIEPGKRFYADLCAMASTVAYENKLVIRNRVTEHWEMHFVEFLDCWNDHLQKKSTKAFIFCDKEVDAQLIVIAFRGTEPFNADDWETDVDFSWYEFSQIGKVHLGFLEALGLANRSQNPQIFDNHTNSAGVDIYKEDPEKPLAYYVLRKKLKELLQVHRNAKFIVTGHSLGGALAVLFPAILFIHKEEALLEKMVGVYTFGQPRVGDEAFAKFMNKNINEAVPTYFRIVYCNDLVPRLPFDDPIFEYKHFGVCLYYNSCYKEKKLLEEPNRNFSLLYFIPLRINALWELVQSSFLQYRKGREFKETKLSTLFRIARLIIPGISSHSPVNYINAVRLGPYTLKPTMWRPQRSLQISEVTTYNPVDLIGM